MYKVVDEVFSLKDIICGYSNVGSKIGESYGFQVYEPLNENILIVDGSSYSGFEILNYKSPEAKLRIFTGGVYLDDLYDEELIIEEDLNLVYNQLVRFDKINSDIFQMLFICLVDYSIRGRD